MRGKGGVAGAGEFDEVGGGVDAGGFGGVLVEEAAESALATGDVEDVFAGLRGEESEGAGEDDVALEFGALFADEVVVPVGGVGPGGGRGGFTFWVFHGVMRDA